MTVPDIRKLEPELQAILDSEKPPALRPMMIAFLIVTGVWLVFGFLPWFAQEGWPWDLKFGLKGKASQFADSFGFINSLFSSLAFAGVIVAIWLQRQELAEQRKELIITQWELKKGAEAQRDSQRELAKQAETNLNATVLNALQGMQDLATSQIQSENGAECQEGEFLRSLVNKLRQGVLSQMLQHEDAPEYSSWIQEELKSWADLSYVRHECSMISSRIAALLEPQNASRSTVNQVRTIQDLDGTALRHFIDYFQRVSSRLAKSMAAYGDTFEGMAATFDKRQDSAGVEVTGWNDLHRLKNLKIQAEGAVVRATQQLAVLTGANT